MLTVKLDTGFNIEVSFAVSSFGRRLFAFILDLILLFFYLYLLSLFSSSLTTRLTWLSTLAFLPVVLYFPVMEIFTNGQTVGKKAMGIQVITLEGGQASVSQYLLRWLLRVIDIPFLIFVSIFEHVLPWYCSILCFFGLACIIISRKSQRIGDIVAGTMVIYTRGRTGWQDTVFTELEAGYQPRYPEVMRISDKDMNSLKSIIDLSKKSRDGAMAMRIAARITGKLGIQTDQQPLDFLQTLMKDYNYYTSHS